MGGITWQDRVMSVAVVWVRKCEAHGKQACGGLGDEERETH